MNFYLRVSDDFKHVALREKGESFSNNLYIG